MLVNFHTVGGTNPINVVCTLILLPHFPVWMSVVFRMMCSLLGQAQLYQVGLVSCFTSHDVYHKVVSPILNYCQNARVVSYLLYGLPDVQGVMSGFLRTCS